MLKKVSLFSGLIGTISDHQSLIKSMIDCSISYIVLNHIESEKLIIMKNEKLEEISSDMIANDLNIRAVHAPFGELDNLSDPLEEERIRTVKKHIKIIEKLPFLKTDILHVHPSIKNHGMSEDTLTKKLINSLEDLLPVAEKAKVKIAVENMPYRYGSGEDIMKIINDFDSPWLGVCLDTGHAKLAGGLQENLEVVKERLFDLHINDNTGVRDSHLQAPYGTIDWSLFLKSLEKTGFDGPMNIEAYPYAGATPKRMVREVEEAFWGDLPIVEFRPEKFAYLVCKNCRHIIIKDKTGKLNCCCDD